MAEPMHLFTIVMLPLLFGLIGCSVLGRHTVVAGELWNDLLRPESCVGELVVSGLPQGARAGGKQRATGFIHRGRIIYIALIAIAPLGLLAFCDSDVAAQGSSGQRDVARGRSPTPTDT